jgi:hypothetical protein
MLKTNRLIGISREDRRLPGKITVSKSIPVLRSLSIFADYIPSDIYGSGGAATKQVSRTLEVGACLTHELLFSLNSIAFIQ